jgi:hypothetical protein
MVDSTDAPRTIDRRDFLKTTAADCCRGHAELEAWILEGELLHFPATKGAGSG